MKVAICDDEQNIRTYIAVLVREMLSGCSVDLYDSGEALLAAKVVYDLIFLDIKMQGISGMETATKLRKKDSLTNIIFITAMEEYALQAFDVGAFHYLLKPIDKVKFLGVLEKAVLHCKEQEMIQKEQKESAILIKAQNGVQKIACRDIYYAEVRNRKIILDTQNGSIEYYGKMAELEKQLKNKFVRCHRSFLVHMKYIVKYDSANILLEGKQNIPIAKKKYAEFVKAYLNYMKQERH